jgi:23S rRNA (adenine1618-N6)-methyltransferase
MPDSPRSTSAPAFHPRNRHRGRYDFDRLLKACPALEPFLIVNPYGKRSLDFADPAAVRTLNRALLAQQYGIAHWDIPPGYLCPPIPGRADYVHGLADLLAADEAGQPPRGASVRVLDIGTGANCIYPLIGHVDYGWRFVGVDIDDQALANARAIVAANRLEASIELRRQADPRAVLDGAIATDERFDATLCNPPFHASAQEAQAGSRRKWRNLGKLDPRRKMPTLNFGGQSNELWCEGGEAAFIARMARQSLHHAGQVRWFSTLVSKGGNLAAFTSLLERLGARDIRTQAMAQGQKQSRFVAWSFLPAEARRRWTAHGR